MRTADPKAPTKEKILAAAQKLMSAKGFTATSVDEICEEAHATKGSFFHFFESKEDLGLVLADRFARAHMERTLAAPYQRIADPMERVLAGIDYAIGIFNDPATPKACLVGTFAQELAMTHPQMRDVCSRSFARWTEMFARDMDAVSREYALPHEAESRELANLLLSIVQGSMLLIKAHRDVSIAVRNLRHFKKYLENEVFKGARKKKEALAR